MLRTRERDGVVYLEVPAAAAAGPAATRLAAALEDACSALEERDDLPRAVVLAGGQGGFWLAPVRQPRDCDDLAEPWMAATRALGRLSAPTVAAIGGDAIGPAWELALACDLRLAAAEARLGSPEVGWGRMPAVGGTQRLTRLAGPALALWLLLRGALLEAGQALELGLVHRVAPAAQLEAELELLLDGLRASAPIALAYTREAVRAAAELPLDDGLRLEADLAVLLQTTADRAEGIGAYLQRRTPRFEGQ